MNNNTGDNMNEHTTSDLAGLAAREAGAPARGPTRIEEIRGRVEAATMGAGLDKFGSAIVDDFGRCVVCGKWTNPGHDDAQSHKDGCAARREEVRYAQALHAIYRTGADDLRHLLNELAGLAAREAGAPARGPTRIEEIRGRLTPKRAEDAAAWDFDADGCVCAECMKGIRLRDGEEWTNGEDVCDSCAARLVTVLRADAGYLLNELAGYQSDLLAGERAAKEARRERDALRAEVERLTVLGPDTEARVTVEARAIASDMLKPVVDTWRTKVAEVEAERVAADDALADARAEVAELKVAHAGKCKAWQDAEKDLDTVARELESVTADLARAHRILAVEQGREGPEGWRYDCADGAWWRKETAGRAWRGWRWVDSGKVPVWRWSCQAQTGYAEAALDALEAADRVLR